MHRIAILLDKALAIFRKDFLTSVRYRSAFLMTGIGIVAELAAFYYLSRAIGPNFRPQGMGYFPFLLVGTGFYTFLMMGINSFLTSVQEAQQTGTLEVLMTSRTSPSTLVFLSAFSAFSRNILRLLIYFAAGLLVLSSIHMGYKNLLAGAATFILSTVIAIALGIIAAAIQLGTHKGSAVMWLFGSMAWLVTGTMFPVMVLPRPLLWIAKLVPITHCLDALRVSLLEGNNLQGVGREIAILTGFSFVLLPAGLVVFSYMLKRARLQGTLSFY
jgi:ABC-2 type transport system permease protein